MKNPHKCGSSFLGLAAGLAVLSCATIAKAIPFASCITNNAGTISFYLNSPGGNVTVTYEDGSTNASYDGVTTGTNLSFGVHSFTLGAHTAYSINVATTGSGGVSVVRTNAIGGGRGLACNVNGSSPNFGRVYYVISTGGAGSKPLYLLNSDISTAAGPLTGGSPAWGGAYRISVGPDDGVYVSDLNYVGANNVNNFTNSMVWKMAPDLSSGQLFLGPIGKSQTSVHLSELSEVQIQGTAPNQTFYVVDGDFPTQPESILGYNFGSSANLPWETAPDVIGYQITPIGGEGAFGNVYAQLTQSTVSNLLYVSNQRNNLACPDMAIWDPTSDTVVWNSFIPTGSVVGTATGDYFVQAGNGGTGSANGGLVASAVSPDGLYLVGLHIDNHLTVVGLTNGIPDVSTIFYVTPPSFSQNGRGIAIDAGDNVIVSSSGAGVVWEYDLGLTGTAVTSGDSTGSTNYVVRFPSTQVGVVATTPQASQGGVNGTPGTAVPGVFTITRTSTNGYGSPLTVNFTLGGTATNGVYTTVPSAGITVGGVGSITIPANQTSVTLSIVPTTNNVPRLTNTVILTLGGGAYSPQAPFKDTVFIQNTSSQQLLISSVGAASMYKAFSNDYAYFTLERLGDTTVGAYTPSTFNYAGTAVNGTDYTTPSVPAFNPGDVTHAVTIQPLVGGVPPVDTANPVYTGNKVASITVAAGGGYTVAPGSLTANLTIIDNAELPAAATLYSNPLTSSADSANWNVTYGASDMVGVATDDYEADFGYDITSDILTTGAIGPAPNGATNVLRMTVNKKYNPGTAAGVNAYPIGQSFSGNYAVRFNMNLIQGSALSVATEGALIGINHNGTETNWWIGSGTVNPLNTYQYWASDGYWFWVCSDAGGAGNGDYIAFTGNGNASTNHGFSPNFLSAFHTSFGNNFKNSQIGSPLNNQLGPFTSDSASGVPANSSANTTGNPANTWADVEVKQINNVITLSIDKIPIFVQTNTTGINTSGTPMLGYNDPFPSVGGPDGAAYYSNLRVVQIGPPVITQISQSGANIVIDFSTTDGDDTISSFSLLSGTNVVGSSSLLVDTVVASTTFTQLGSGAFEVTTPKPANSATYYRIKHK